MMPMCCQVHRGNAPELKEDDGEGVVWQLVQTEGEVEEGDERTQHIIYVTYQGEGEEAETESQAATEETPNLQMLQQLTQVGDKVNIKHTMSVSELKSNDLVKWAGVMM